MEKKNSTFKMIKWFYFLLIVTLIVYNVYYIVGPAFNESINPYNHRLDQVESQVIRGNIFDRSGEILATTNVYDDYFERYYPYHEIFAHVIGYSDLNKSGLESLVNLELIQSHSDFTQQILRELSFEEANGDHVYTTLDAKMQQIAYEALGDYNGAVLAMDPRTGEILSMVSKPSYDPNEIIKNWESLRTNTDQTPLLNRATQGLYPPGSIYKIVTTTAYLKDHDPDEFFYFCQGEDHFGQRTLRCFDGHGHGREGLKEAFVYSCNTGYATLAMEIQQSVFEETNALLLFNRELPSELPYSQSLFGLEHGASKGILAETSIGQGETLMSPYHALLMTSAIANEGVLMKPYMVDSVVSDTQKVISKAIIEQYAKLYSMEEAELLTDYMISVVDIGTGRQAYSEAYSVAGKTGSAEVDESITHGWFVGFAPANDPKIAVAILVENGQSGGKSAGPIAKELFDYYLK